MVHVDDARLVSAEDEQERIDYLSQLLRRDITRPCFHGDQELRAYQAVQRHFKDGALDVEMTPEQLDIIRFLFAMLIGNDRCRSFVESGVPANYLETLDSHHEDYLEVARASMSPVGTVF